MGRLWVKGTEDPSWTPPRLTFDTLPVKRHEQPVTATPPLHMPASVPFWWEEAPGKPRKEPAPWPAAVRRLDPPPRVAVVVVEKKAKATAKALSSPSGMVDGPFARGREGRPVKKSVKKGEARGRTVSPWRRGRSGWKGILEGVSPRSFSSSNDEGEDGGRGEGTKTASMRITLRRSRSLSSHSTSSRWLAAIYGNLKQVVQRRRGGRV